MSTTHRHPSSRAGMYGLARHAKLYERGAALLARPLYRRVATDVAAAELAPGAVVVDVGTGPGLVPLMIAEQCPELSVTGVDLSAEMIARARGAAQSRQPGPGASVTFEVADVAALPWGDESVDLLVSSLSMHHWDDRLAGLDDIVRVLRPGAQAWIYDVRSMVRRAASAGPRPDADLRVELPLSGSSRFNPIGRLVLTRHRSDPSSPRG